MNKSNTILSDITSYMKYQKYLPSLQRRETWEEMCVRNAEMHVRRYPQLEQEIWDVYAKYVVPKKVLPSMRSLQFGGRPIELSPNRIFNCAYSPCDHPAVFSETMFLLLGGTGMGYSVQRHHVEELPPIRKPLNRSRRFLVGDSIEGWADCIKVLMEAYFYGKSNPMFDYSDIRPKGAALITSGGKAPGPQPLKDCVHNIRSILDAKSIGDSLNTIECHDIMCHIADAVLAGGIRRAALISLFSYDDVDMLTCKHGSWWELNPQRGRANNSAVIIRSKVDEEAFHSVWDKIVASGSGEPGVYFSNDKDWGTNPCCEIGLRPNQFCNLTETNVSDVEDQDDLEARVKAGAFLGTLQAGYTDFHYLRPVWQRNTEKDALIGVGMTGIGSGKVLGLDLKKAAQVVKDENERVAQLLGINAAARCTTVKPSGTSSLVLGCSSGIHAWHNDYYIRRIRVGKNEPIYDYLKEHHPNLVEDEYFRPEDQAVIQIPQEAPCGSILRTESPENLLERVRKFSLEWVREGHRDGANTHNVSCTISVKEDKWGDVGDWMWRNRNDFNGIAVLPHFGGSLIQPPFEDCSKEVFDGMYESLEGVDLTQIVERDDYTEFNQEAACAGGQCETS